MEWYAVHNEMSYPYGVELAGPFPTEQAAIEWRNARGEECEWVVMQPTSPPLIPQFEDKR